MKLMQWFKEWGWFVYIGLISICISALLCLHLHRALHKIEEKGLKNIIEDIWEGKVNVTNKEKPTKKGRAIRHTADPGTEFSVQAITDHVIVTKTLTTAILKMNAALLANPNYEHCRSLKAMRPGSSRTTRYIIVTNGDKK